MAGQQVEANGGATCGQVEGVGVGDGERWQESALKILKILKAGPRYM
jgi:hypothetical protein